MNRFIVSCVDRDGMQYGSTFDTPDDELVANVIRQGWEEAKRLCGRITAVASANVCTIDGRIIGTLR